MKKITLALLLATAFLFSGCAKIDWTPVHLVISVIDSNDHSVATPENKHLLEGTTIEFLGNVIPLELETSPLTKMVFPLYTDRFFIGNESRFKNCLVFGEISGEYEFKDEPFKITWPDGSTDVITYTRKLNRITIDAKEGWKLNGEKCDNPVVIRKYFAE